MADANFTAGNWELFQLRKSIWQGLTDRTISDDFFVFDLLKALCDDDIADLSKLQLMVFLEEHAALLVNASSVDDVMSSLLDIYHECRKAGDARKLFIGQLLVTMTSIAVQFESVSEISLNIHLQLLHDLLKVISHVNDTKMSTVRLRALCCLRELEVARPGLLARKLDSLYALMKGEKSYLYQEYVGLFVCVLQNVVTSLGQQTDCVPDNKLTEMLCVMKDNITNYSKEDYESVSSKTIKKMSPLPDNIDTKELTAAVSYIVDTYHVFTPPAMAAILDSLTSIMIAVPSVPVTVFKSIILQQMPTYNLVILHTILRLQTQLGERLFSEGESAILVKHLTLLTNDPLATAGQRLLCLHWLMQIAQEKPGSTDIPPLYPRVFDGIDTQTTKAHMVTLCAKHSSDLTAVLLPSLMVLHSHVTHGNSHKAASAFFKSLYQIYRHHPTLRDDIVRKVTEFSSLSPHLVPYIIDFIEKISPLTTESGDCQAILLSLHNRVLDSYRDNGPSIPLTYILQVLHKVTRDTAIPPKLTIDFLDELLSQSEELLDGQWEYGNQLIGVANNIIQFHNSRNIFMDIARLLHRIMTEYGDIEVRDHAKLYYTLLTGATHDKVSKVLSESTIATEKDGHNLANLVGDASTYISQKTLTIADKDVFSLQQLSRTCEWTPELPTDTPNPHTSPNDHSIEVYYSRLSHFSAHIRINCSLCLVPTSPYATVYAVTLYIKEKEQHFHNVQVIDVPVLNTHDVQEFTIELSPKLPLPSTFHIQALFSSNSRQTILSDLSQISLDFSDLFMPLPWILSGMTLFNLEASLWTDIETRAKDLTDESKNCIESVHTIETSLPQLAAVLQRKYPHFYFKNGERHHLIIYLPPHTHLLMRLHQQRDRVVIATVTDEWRILGNLQHFLDSLESDLKS